MATTSPRKPMPWGLAVLGAVCVVLGNQIPILFLLAAVFWGAFLVAVARRSGRGRYAHSLGPGGAVTSYYLESPPDESTRTSEPS